MPKYSWKFQELFSNGNIADIDIRISADNKDKAKKILLIHIIKMTRYGIPRIYITPKGNTIIRHSNETRAHSLPFVNIDYDFLQKIQSIQPTTVFEFNHQASPFVPSYNYNYNYIQNNDDDF